MHTQEILHYICYLPFTLKWMLRKATIRPRFAWHRLFLPKNFHLGRFFKFSEITIFLTVCYFFKVFACFNGATDKKIPFFQELHKYITWSLPEWKNKNLGVKQVKVKCSHYRPGVAQRVGRDIAILFHDRGTRRGWVVSSTPRPDFTPGKDPVHIAQEAEWAQGPVWTGGKSLPHWDSIPDHPALSQSLYWLNNPAQRSSTCGMSW